ncbi:MAG: hypothetical protein MJK14_20805 [Rivularia sp. ALOHA_DT_140]|nr:hypothetical protein [Rivularia sp. ALOHA_DT_140]
MLQTLEQIEKEGSKVNNILLQPLSIKYINQLIADALNCSTEKSTSLGQLVNNKTQGNPFFLTQLLQYFYKEKLLSFDHNQNHWQWKISEIERVGITDNVVELTIEKITKLDEKTQNILQLAACIGNQFNLEVLSVVNDKLQITTARELQPALDSGLILPLSNDYKIPLLWNAVEISTQTSEISDAFIPKIPSNITYKFLHDRVQQAAYALIPEAEKKAIHLQVGRLLLKNTSYNELEDNIFDIVNQLNEGYQLITEQSERDELAKLNLRAGKKAKASTAYQPALRYLETGLELLASNSWNEYYRLTLELHEETLEVLYLNKKYERVEELAISVLQSVHNNLDKVKVYEALLLVYYAIFEPQKAIDTALGYLAELGIYISQKESENEIINLIKQKQKSLELVLKGKEIEDLANLPTMTDPYKLAGLQILQHIFAATATTKPALHIEIVLKQITLLITYGNAPESVGVYSYYGATICGLLRDIDYGYKFGKLAIKLQENSNVMRLEALTTHLYYGCILHWKEFLRNTKVQQQLLKGYQTGLDTGNNEFAGYTIISYCLITFFGGYTLEVVEQDYIKYTNLLKKIKIEYPYLYIRICQKIITNLVNESENKYRLFEEYSWQQEDAFLKQISNGWLLLIANFCKTISCYIFKDYFRAFESGINAEKYVNSCSYYLPAPQHNFYSSLSFLAHHHNCTVDQQKEILEKV